ncbi:NADH dehydrogenase [ubiquinone] 1 alpha subcomplex subunit 8-like [Paramacrobiotus metropolitanus]|uniref:NADH dehydrogenase [ubiquinone] 1 alpha subcomplex subunit 8-like n=1 Tax=Paramacrobiotus metropolitanus TaxID=2943436 RepID=UPI0024456D67|nr:NADH dehydrogenase [ubiquinone] 1 alpha subcomplex subunit 8-like [Paramacrobiotus metropolitanus]
MVLTKDVYLPSYEDLTVEEINMSSPALKAGAQHFGKYCDEPCKEFMLCRVEEKDARRCLREGKAVTACGLEFFRKMKKFCYEPFEKHWHCLEDSSPDMEAKYCRKSQYVLDDCVRKFIGVERPNLGYFSSVRIHDSTTRPRPQKLPLRDYKKLDELPADYPRIDPQGGSRWLGQPQ